MSSLARERRSWVVLSPAARDRQGLTLAELLVVIGAIAIVFALIASRSRYSESARQAARRTQCLNNLHQIANAFYNYHVEYGVYPPARTLDAKGRPLHSWRTLILPYMEQGELYQTINLSKPWDDPVNLKAFQSMPLHYQCPSQLGPPSTTCYLGLSGPGLAFDPDRPRRLDEFKDGTARTLRVIEVSPTQAVPWMAPIDAGEAEFVQSAPNLPHNHPGGACALFADGTFRFLKDSTTPGDRKAMTTIANSDEMHEDAW